MSFGVAQNAIATIKSNRNLLSKRGRLKNTLSGFGEGKTEYNLPKATSKELLGIRKRMQLEHRHRRVKQIILFSVLMTAIILILIYFA
jgi:hypothetical protein